MVIVRNIRLKNKNKKKTKLFFVLFWASCPLIKKKIVDIHYHLPPNESVICPKKRYNALKLSSITDVKVAKLCSGIRICFTHSHEGFKVNVNK